MIKKIKNIGRAAIGTLLSVALLFAGIPVANAVPAICVMPTSGTVSGLTLVQDINSCYAAALGLFPGGTAPGSPTTGMLWWNTSTGVVAQFDGTGWNPLWTVDSTNHLNAMQIGGGVPGTLVSASVTDLWSVSPSSVSITGTTSITQFANGDAVPGSVKIVTFAGIMTLTQGTPIGLPNNGSNITTAAGDYAIVLALTSTNVQVIQYTRATGAALSTQGLNIGASALGQSALGYNAPVNLQLAASVSANNLTVSALGVNGSNPSSSNPVLVNFRSQTLNNISNGIVYGQITAALSFQVTSGNTMGCTTAVLCRLWVELICQTESSGACTSVLLGLSNQSVATQIYPLAEDGLQSTGSGTAGGGSAGVIQTSVASLTGKAIRIVGYVEVTWTSGTGWATTPSKVQVFGPGVHKPGDVVQTLFVTSASGTTTVSLAVTNLSIAITPTSAVNLIRTDAGGFCQMTNASSACAGQLYRATTALGTQQSVAVGGGGTATGAMVFNILDQPITTSSVTYAVKVQSGGANNITFTPNGMIVQEIMGALEPANDDATPLRLVG